MKTLRFSVAIALWGVIGACGLVINLEENPEYDAPDGGGNGGDSDADADGDTDADSDADSDSDSDTNSNTGIPCKVDEDCQAPNLCTHAKCIDELCRVFNNDCPPDEFECTVEQCDERTGECMHLPDHEVCDDGIHCTNDGCMPEDLYNDIRGCRSIPNHPLCDDGVDCTREQCQPISDVADGNGCVVTDTCVPEDFCSEDAFCDDESEECATVVMEDPYVCAGDGNFCVPVAGCEPEWTDWNCWSADDCDGLGGAAPVCSQWACDPAEWGGNFCHLEPVCAVGQGCLPDGTCVDPRGG